MLIWWTKVIKIYVKMYFLREKLYFYLEFGMLGIQVIILIYACACTLAYMCIYVHIYNKVKQFRIDNKLFITVKI